jgi:hypothetical protein
MLFRPVDGDSCRLPKLIVRVCVALAYSCPLIALRHVGQRPLLTAAPLPID